MELAGLIFAFALIFILRLKDFDHALTIILACLIIGLTSGKSLAIFPKVFLVTVMDLRTWEITAAVAMITLMGYVLKETKMIVGLIENLRGFLPSRALVTLIPAIFGVLSMPGGAMISAPFNEPEADRLNLKPEERTFVNIWFRHVWYWASPISPTTFLAVSMAGLTLRDFIIVNAMLFFAAWGVGFFMTRKCIPHIPNMMSQQRNYYAILLGISPIVTALALSLLEVPVWLAVATGTLIAFLVQRTTRQTIWKSLRQGINWQIAAAVFATLYFRYMLTTTGYVTLLLQDLIGSGVPLILLLIMVPLLIGSISGMPTMGIGIVFPLLLPILPEVNIATVTIIFAGITTGYMASPLHLCLVLTNHYYQSNLKQVFRYLLPATFALYAIALAYHLLRWYLGVGP